MQLRRPTVMFESGYYPAGAEFDPNAPWNEKESRMKECDICGGTGYETYYEKSYDDDDTVITEEEYNALPEDQRARELCPCCRGEGTIDDDDDDEPDGYDYYDD